MCMLHVLESEKISAATLNAVESRDLKTEAALKQFATFFLDTGKSPHLPVLFFMCFRTSIRTKGQNCKKKKYCYKSNRVKIKKKE